jgi:hypothetical protein
MSNKENSDAPAIKMPTGSRLVLSSSPHLSAGASLNKIMGGVLLALLWAKKTGKLLAWIVSAVTIVMGLLGLLESLQILTEVPIFTYGIPAVLSVYFDFFSGFIQALVFTLLSMVYIGGSLPAPAEEAAE